MQSISRGWHLQTLLFKNFMAHISTQAWFKGVKVKVLSHSVMSNSLQPHGWESSRLLCPWNSPGKHIGVGSRSLLQGNPPNTGIESRSPKLQSDSLMSEPTHKYRRLKTHGAYAYPSSQVRPSLSGLAGTPVHEDEQYTPEPWKLNPPVKSLSVYLPTIFSLISTG